ncbi:MAG: hypothetical protein EAZ20_03280 [Bacteroidetes bacterium]|nr:MAG: hypothetical protein EAZ20_03280 [Bacteroidota bacterium]
MFKIVIFLCLFLCFAEKSFAQQNDENIVIPEKNTPYPQEIAEKIKGVYNANKHKIPDEQTLKTMPLSTKYPDNINEILYQNDWLEVAQYYFHPSNPQYNANEIQKNFIRHHRTKGVLLFRFRHPTEDSPYPPHLEFVESNNELEFVGSNNELPQKIQKKGTHFYYYDKNADKTGYSPMVSYKDGMLIIDVTESGKLNDLSNPRRFRNVYMAVPKFFSLEAPKNNVFVVPTEQISPNSKETDGVPTLGKTYSPQIAQKIKAHYLANKSKMPTREALKSMSLNPNLPQNIAQELFKYDWMLVNSYDFNIRNDGYDEYKESFKYQRESPTKGILVFKMTNNATPTLEFEDNNMYLPKTIQKKGQYYFYSLKEQMPDMNVDYPVVDYKNGFLIVDFTTSGKVNDALSQERVRQVFMAVPKFFDAVTGEMLSVTTIAQPTNTNIKTNNSQDLSAYDDNNAYTKDQLMPAEIAEKIRGVYNANKHKIPDEQTLKTMPLSTKYPDNINEILYQSDWIEVAQYYFNPLPSEARYSSTEIQKNFIRHHTTKGVLMFRFRLPEEDSPYPPRLEFVDNDSNIPKIIQKKGTHFYYQNKNATKTGYSTMVNYKDGILIFDIPYSEAMNDFSNPRRFRMVYMAVPKMF